VPSILSPSHLVKIITVEGDVTRLDSQCILVRMPPQIIIALSQRRALGDAFNMIADRICDDPQLGERLPNGGRDWVPLRLYLNFEMRSEQPRF